jgi:predicted Zn-dependent protease
VREVALRAALVLAAAGGALWLAGPAWVARDVGRAEALARAGDRPAAARLLRDAAARTGSTAPDVRHAQLLTFARRPRDAAAVLARVVRAEPENAEAWAQLALARRAAGDGPGYARARARYEALSPSPSPGG